MRIVNLSREAAQKIANILSFDPKCEFSSYGFRPDDKIPIDPSAEVHSLPIFYVESNDEVTTFPFTSDIVVAWDYDNDRLVCLDDFEEWNAERWTEMPLREIYCRNCYSEYEKRLDEEYDETVELPVLR